MVKHLVPAAHSHAGCATRRIDSNNYPSAREELRVCFRTAKVAVRYYLLAAMCVLFLTWSSDWGELGPSWLLLSLLSWPFTGIVLDGVSSLIHLQSDSSDYERHKLLLISVMLCSGSLWWGGIGTLIGVFRPASKAQE